MADSAPLAGLLDRAGNVFSLAGKLGRAFHEEHQGQAGQIDAAGWNRHAPAFDEFCAALLDLRDAMQNPPDGFAPVAEPLLQAARIAKGIRDAMQRPDGRTWATYLGFFPDLNSVCENGWRAVKQVTKARRLDDPFAFVDEPAAYKRPGIDATPQLVPDDAHADNASFIERLLAGPDDAELSPRELALLKAHLKQPISLSAIQRERRVSPTRESETCNRRNKLKLIRDFNRNLQAAIGNAGNAHQQSVPRRPAEPAADATMDSTPTNAKTERSTELGEGRIDDQAAVRLLSVFTNGLADERLVRAESVLRDDKLTVNDKLTKIDELIPLPPTVSAENLGKLVGGKSKQAVMKTEWWIKNRKGEKENEIDRRRDKHRERAKQHEPNQTNDEDD